jgi:acetate kinase
MALKGMEQFGIEVDLKRDEEALRGEREMLISADSSKVKVFALPSGEEMMLNEDVAAIMGWPVREAGAA